jgi:hypothetical protein
MFETFAERDERDFNDLRRRKHALSEVEGYQEKMIYDTAALLNASIAQDDAGMNMVGRRSAAIVAIKMRRGLPAANTGL